jgi:hypothetical protein
MEDLVRRLFRGRDAEPERDVRLLAFARGLAIGALVGAAFAGSRLWPKAKRRRL